MYKYTSKSNALDTLVGPTDWKAVFSLPEATVLMVVSQLVLERVLDDWSGYKNYEVNLIHTFIHTLFQA